MRSDKDWLKTVVDSSSHCGAMGKRAASHTFHRVHRPHRLWCDTCMHAYAGLDKHAGGALALDAACHALKCRVFGSRWW
jgi:hypothetical protein